MTALPYAEVIAAAQAHPRTFVEVERHPGARTAVVRLTEPELLNPLSLALLVQLIDRLSELAADSDLRKR